jgi:hypothetical protein
VNNDVIQLDCSFSRGAVAECISDHPVSVTRNRYVAALAMFHSFAVPGSFVLGQVVLLSYQGHMTNPLIGAASFPLSLIAIRPTNWASSMVIQRGIPFKLWGIDEAAAVVTATWGGIREC